MRKIAAALLLCSAALAQDAPFAAARQDSWKIIGPGGGGAQFNPTVCASDPNRVFVTSDMTGGFVSNDGGSTWRMFNLRGTPRFVVCDPLDSDIAYVQTIGLWRTSDGAKTWRLVYPNPWSVSGIRAAGDHGGESLVTGSPPLDLQALTVDPADSKILYAVMADAGGGRALYVSSDWGSTWTNAGALPNGVAQPFGNHTARVLVDPKSPATDRRIYVVTLNSVTLRDRGTWRQLPPPQGVAMFMSVSAGFASGSDRPIIYGIAGIPWNGTNVPAAVWKSMDGGATWQRTDADLLAKLNAAPGNYLVPAVAASYAHPEIAYVSYWCQPQGAPNAILGVAKTADSGRKWSLVWRDTDSAQAPNMHDSWMNDRFGPSWAGNPVQLEAAPSNPDLVFGTDYGRTMRTRDGGATWEGVYSHRLESGVFSTTGLDLTTTYGVHFDPFDANRILGGWTDIGLMLSEDGGSTWTSATRYGIPNEWVNTTYWVEFDPEVKGRVWAATSHVHDLPRPKMWRNRDVSGYGGGMVTSTDGGRTWTVSNTGIDQAAMTHVLLDSSSPPGNRTLYACAFGKGVFKSTDDGRTWTLKNRGIAGTQPFAWRITRARNGALYLVVARRSERGEIGDSGDGALYRSTDGAETWQKMTLPAGCNGPTGLLLDPADERRMALSAWGRLSGSGPDTGGGIFVSSDGGGSWTHALSTDQHIYDITADPLTGAWYAGGFESSIYRSADRGQTWARVRGFNFKWGHRVIPDPRNPGMIFVTTFGGSVWYGPASGDPGASEDITWPAAVRFTPPEIAPGPERVEPPQPRGRTR